MCFFCGSRLVLRRGSVYLHVLRIHSKAVLKVSRPWYLFFIVTYPGSNNRVCTCLDTSLGAVRASGLVASLQSHRLDYFPATNELDPLCITILRLLDRGYLLHVECHDYFVIHRITGC